MKRDHNKTVTRAGNFAIIVPCSKDGSTGTGTATFMKEFGPPRPVRPLTRDDLKTINRKLRRAAAAHFDAVLALRNALDANDSPGLATAKERLERAYAFYRSEHPRTANLDEKLERDFDKTLARVMGGSPEEARRHFEGEAPGARASNDANLLFSYEVTRLVDSNAEIVLWFIGGTFRPAIFCSDLETALYVHTFFFAPTGVAGFRVCPHCSEQFLQDKTNQDYCRPAHREAHRVARFRAKKKEKESNGTQKAR